MIGRAGRRQFDEFGVAVIMTGAHRAQPSAAADEAAPVPADRRPSLAAQRTEEPRGSRSTPPLPLPCPAEMRNKEHYERLRLGHDMVESRLHTSLQEHLNSEIVAGTIQDVQQARTRQRTRQRTRPQTRQPGSRPQNAALNDMFLAVLLMLCRTRGCALLRRRWTGSGTASCTSACSRTREPTARRTQRLFTHSPACLPACFASRPQNKCSLTPTVVQRDARLPPAAALPRNLRPNEMEHHIRVRHLFRVVPWAPRSLLPRRCLLKTCLLFCPTRAASARTCHLSLRP